MQNINKIVIRSMARRARTIKSKDQRRIAVTTKANQRIDAISKGDREIVIGSSNTHESVHHSADASTFENLKLRTDVSQGLECLKITQPTIIQMLTIPLIMEEKNIFCAAQTGSGKTVVFAAPIIHKLKNQVDEGFVKRLSRPRALVIAPARELALQILSVFKSLSHFAPFRSVGLIGQKQKKWTRDYMKGAVDIVVGTPSTVLKYQQKGLLNLADLQYLVLDEADTLMDDNFFESTDAILNLCHFHERHTEVMKPPVQCILAAATLPPKGVLSAYRKLIPNLEVCQSNLHRVLPHVKHKFVKTTQKEKFDLLLSRLKKIFRHDADKCIIFCNTSKSCNWVSLKLSESDVKHSKLHGNMNPQTRFKDFENFFSGKHRVLVSTDLASRGLDTTDVTLVINYDCPFNTSDYIHRSGRTGRARQLYAGEAEVLTYMTQNKEVIFARKIQKAAERNEELHDVKMKQNSPKDNYLKNMKKYHDMKESEAK